MVLCIQDAKCMHSSSEGKVASMFLVTWIEGEEVKYRLINNEQLLQPLVFSLGDNVIVQNLNA